MGITVAPIGAWFLAWIALAPLWILVIKSYKLKTNPPAPRPLPLALLWGIGYHGVALSWITGIHPMDWLGVPWLPSLTITLFCWAFISLWGGILVSVWAALMVRLDRQKSLVTCSNWYSHLVWIRKPLECRSFVVEFSGLHSITAQSRNFTFRTTFWHQYCHSGNCGF